MDKSKYIHQKKSDKILPLIFTANYKFKRVTNLGTKANHILFALVTSSILFALFINIKIGCS